MTYLEKLFQEHPEMKEEMNLEKLPISIGCPPKWWEIPIDDCVNMTCTACWNREAPEETKIEKEDESMPISTRIDIALEDVITEKVNETLTDDVIVDVLREVVEDFDCTTLILNALRAELKIRINDLNIIDNIESVVEDRVSEII